MFYCCKKCKLIKSNNHTELKSGEKMAVFFSFGICIETSFKSYNVRVTVVCHISDRKTVTAHI